jgi:hypothetical protein
MSTPKKKIKGSSLKQKQPVTKSTGGNGIIRIPKLTDELYNLEIYIKYEKLDNTTLVYILKQIEHIKNDLIKQLQLDRQLSKLSYSDVLLTPTLDVTLIHTGRSIIIRFNEGWKPKIKIRKGDLIIDIPGKVAICGLVLYTLYTGYEKYLDSENKRLDILLKKLELKEKLDKVGNKTDSIQASRTTVNLIKNINRNSNIKFLRVNNLEIKSNSK